MKIKKVSLFFILFLQFIFGISIYAKINKTGGERTVCNYEVRNVSYNHYLPNSIDSFYIKARFTLVNRTNGSFISNLDAYYKIDFIDRSITGIINDSILINEPCEITINGGSESLIFSFRNFDNYYLMEGNTFFKYPSQKPVLKINEIEKTLILKVPDYYELPYEISKNSSNFYKIRHKPKNEKRLLNDIEWYLNGIKINDSTEKQIIPENYGVYYVKCFFENYGVISNEINLGLDFWFNQDNNCINRSYKLANFNLKNLNEKDSKLDEIIEDIEKQIRFYPNPIANLLYIETFVCEEIDFQVTIFNSDGTFVKSLNATFPISNKSLVQFDFNDLSKGLYFLKFQSDKIVFNKILLKQ